MDGIDSERLHRLERAAAGWTLVGKVAVGVFFLVEVGRIGGGLMMAPRAERLLEVMLGVGTPLPKLAEWVFAAAGVMPVTGSVVAAVAGAGLYCVSRLPRAGALWGALLCLVVLGVVDVLIWLVLSIPVTDVISGWSGAS